MPKFSWYKSEETKKQKLDTEYRSVLGRAFGGLNVKTSDAARARFLGMDDGTYRNKKDNPEKTKQKELRIMVEKLDLSSEEVGKFMGCRR